MRSTPLLAIEAADVGDDRRVLVAERQPLAQRPLVLVLPVQRLDAELGRDEAVDLGVPHVVVDSVQDPAELVLVDMKCVPEAPALVGVRHLPGRAAVTRCDEVRVDDPALHQVDGVGAVLEAFVVEKRSGRVKPVAHKVSSPAMPWWLKLWIV